MMLSPDTTHILLHFMCDKKFLTTKWTSHKMWKQKYENRQNSPLTHWCRKKEVNKYSARYMLKSCCFCLWGKLLRLQQLLSSVFTSLFLLNLFKFHEAALRKAYRFQANCQRYDMQVFCTSRNCKHITQLFSQCVLLYQRYKSLEHKALYIRISHILFHEACECVRIWAAKLWLSNLVESNRKQPKETF